MARGKRVKPNVTTDGADTDNVTGGTSDAQGENSEKDTCDFDAVDGLPKESPDSPTQEQPESVQETSTNMENDREEEEKSPQQDPPYDDSAKFAKHADAMREVFDAFASFQLPAGGTTPEGELRRVTAFADTVESELDVSESALAAAAKDGKWPAAALAYAREVVSAVVAFEAATSAASVRLGEDLPGGGGNALKGVYDAFNKLISSWINLRDKAQDQRPELIYSVRLNSAGRERSLQPLCDALLDKAAEIYDALHKRNLSATDIDATQPVEHSAGGMSITILKFQNLLKQDCVRQALDRLSVEIPPHDLFHATSGMALDQVQDRKAGQTPEGMKETSTAPSSPMATRDRRTPSTSGAGVSADTAASSLAIALQEDAIDQLEGTREVPRRSAHEDPLGCTVPAISLYGNNGLDDPAAVGLGQVEALLDRFHPNVGCPELWHAVYIGDCEAVKKLIDVGACNAKMRDASEHSVLWHAIAFNHANIANLILDMFPPDTENGVDLSEIHQRKGDTFLHLLCHHRNFGPEVARLFKRVSAGVPAALFPKVNCNGVTFMQVAALSMNFWVLTFVARNYPVQSKNLLIMTNHNPMRNLAEVLPKPVPPNFIPPDKLPEHFRLSDMLQQDEDGSIPYADLAFDVGPDKDRVAACRFMAHRVVVMPQSPVLFDVLQKTPLKELVREKTHAAIVRIDPLISQEVWRCVLQFMYTGAITCPFGTDVEKIVELLQACSLYKLPEPLRDFTQFCIFPLLPKSSPAVVLRVFETAWDAEPDEKNTSWGCAREASTYLLLRSAHVVCEGMDASDAAALMERLVRVAEHSVFNKMSPPAPVETVAPLEGEVAAVA